MPGIPAFPLLPQWFTFATGFPVLSSDTSGIGVARIVAETGLLYVVVPVTGQSATIYLLCSESFGWHMVCLQKV